MMAQVLCDECLRTYKPYTYSETIQRALVSGVDEWQGDDNVDDIRSRYNNLLYVRLGISGTIRNLFPSVQDFRDNNRQFNIERRKKIFACFLCFDCEKYLCAKCVTKHSEHFTFSEDDKNNVDKWDKIETKIMQVFSAEGDTKEEYIKQERSVLCDVVDVRDSASEAEWDESLSSGKEDRYMITYDIGKSYCRRNICILNDNQTFLVISKIRTHIKIYNIISYKLIDTIELPYIPAGITEIPSTDPSQHVIVVSFPDAGQIKIMDIQRKPADIISSIDVHGRCHDLAYCNNKLITLCGDCLDGEWCEYIRVVDMSGEIINIINLKVWWVYGCSSNSVHSESETIYVCHGYDRVMSLSLTGQVLHSTIFTDLIPRNICVDRDQNVYVMGDSLPLYKLSSDLSEREKIIDKEAANVREVKSIVHHTNKIYIADLEGCVYIFSVD